MPDEPTPVEMDRVAADAYARGRAAAIIEARLDAHDRHLSTINGSIGRLAASQEQLGRDFRDSVVAQEERDKVAASQREDIAAQTSQRFTRQQKIAGVVTLVAVLLSAIATAAYTILTALS